MPNKCEIKSIIHQKEEGVFSSIIAQNSQGTVIGGADISKLKTDGKEVFHIHEIAVKPDCRRFGIGSAILSAATAIAQGSGCDLIFLVPYPITWGDRERRAPPTRANLSRLEHFYKQAGFEPCKPPKDIGGAITPEGLITKGMCKRL